MKTRILTAVAALLITGCASSPQPSAPIKEPTRPKDPDKAVIAGLKKILKDPDSAKIERLNEPQKRTFHNQLPLFRREPVTGYAVCYSVNAKNSYGGYAGSSLFIFLFDGEQIVWARNQNRDDIIEASQIHNECKKLQGAN